MSYQCCIICVATVNTGHIVKPPVRDGHCCHNLYTDTRSFCSLNLKLGCKNLFFKVFKFNQIIFIIQYRNFQNRVPRCPIPSTEMSSTEYRDVAYVQYRDVQIPRCPDTHMYLWCVYL
jgi:hypothetical protein